MARSKQNKKNAGTSTDGKYRKETKEERRVRLADQEKAREECLKLLPYGGGAVVFFLILFAIYVRSVPPAQVVEMNQPQFQGGVPEFMNVETGPMVQDALDDAEQVLKNLKTEEDGGAEKQEAQQPEETIEL